MPDLSTVKARIDKYLDLLRPVIREFLSNPTLPKWVMPESVDNETRNFYNDLAIPLYYPHRPALLLHELGNTSNPNGPLEYLRLREDTTVVRLCQHWGFYFAAGVGIDCIGSRDLERMIDRMSSDPSWVFNAFKDPNPEKVLIVNARNELIASHRVSKVPLARWTVFRLFIEVAKEVNGGALHDDIRRHWLLFQILRVGGEDHFLRFIQYSLCEVTTEQLDSLRIGLTPTAILGPAFDPPLNHFFYVLDEAQVAGKEHMGSFADANGVVSQPILPSLIRSLVSPLVKTIVAGTGFSLELFRTVLTSGVGKETAEWDNVYSTGDFLDQDAQLAYISRYLPPSFLISPSGEILKARMYEWLRGRHRFTARYLEDLLKGNWEANRPASPHKLLNAYVHELADFTPIDAETTLLEQEADIEPPDICTFQWGMIEQEHGMLEKLSHSIYSYMTRGQYPMWQSEWETIVDCGLARFIVKDTAVVDEPLTLVSIMRYFESQHLADSGNIKRLLQDDKDKAFEEHLLLAITQFLRDARPLTDRIRFHPPMPGSVDVSHRRTREEVDDEAEVDQPSRKSRRK